MNNVQVIGRLTKDPELKEVGGSKVCNFTVAVNDGYFNRDNKWVDQPTAFIDVQSWDTGAIGISEKFRKGDLIFIDQAKIRQENWLDKETGAKRSKLSLRVFHYQAVLVAPKDAANDSGDDSQPQQEEPNGGTAPPTKPATKKQSRGKKAATQPAPEEAADDIPF